MGSWSVSCGISNIAIVSGNECCIIPIKGSSQDYGGYLPVTLPIFGVYNDYGGMEEIVKDKNTELIENYLGITIEEFVEFLVDGKFTYDRSEVKPITKKLEDNGKLSEVKDWRFMWVDKKVYDVMSQNYDKWERGNHNFGTPEMLNLLGFEEVNDGSIENYDPKRFNKKYKKGDSFFYSDGNTLLSDKNQYIFYTDKGNENSLCNYMELPAELEYIKEKTGAEVWRILSRKDRMDKIGYIFGTVRGYLSAMEFMELVIGGIKERGEEIPEDIADRIKKEISIMYFDDMEEFGDRMVGLCNVRSNMHAMSSRFYPHVLHLTPQCGEYEIHQILLDEFAKINRVHLDRWSD